VGGVQSRFRAEADHLFIIIYKIFFLLLRVGFFALIQTTQRQGMLSRKWRLLQIYLGVQN
jgi:hypothetical protein